MSPFAVTNPATGEVEARFPADSNDRIDAALESTHSTFTAWRRVSTEVRAEHLRRLAVLVEERKADLADIVSREMGKRVGDAKGELDICISIANYYADNATSLLADKPLTTSSGARAFVRKTPIGPLLGIMPWNYPHYQVFRFAAPNLVAGNTVVIKHAEQCPETAASLVSLFHDAGFPPGAYVNLFATHEQLESVIADDRIVGVSLTGSERAGAHVAALAGRHLKKVVLELGGSDPYLILETDDMATTVDHATRARLSNGGQSCNAGKRFIVMDHLYDDFVAQLWTRFSELHPGDPFDEASAYGPMASSAALDNIRAQVQDAVDHGAISVVGDASKSHPGCMEPTILTEVPKSARAYAEELFGPVAVVHKVHDIVGAIELANDSRFGLGAAVFHSDVATALEVADQLDVGMVFVNSREGGGAELPFGGTKKSGFGRELGPEGIDEFVNKKLLHLPSDS